MARLFAELDGKAAGDLSSAAEDRLADDGSGNHLLVEHDGEWTSDILLGHLGKLARARGVELERHDRLAGALIETGLGIGELLAGHNHALFQQIRLAVFGFGPVDDLRIGRRALLQGLLRRHRGIDQSERKLCSGTDDLDQLFGVAQSRYLHENTIGALALDRGLDQPHCIDAPLDDLDGLIDHLPGPFDERGLGHGQPNEPAARIDDLDRALPGAPGEAAERLRELPQLRQRLIDLIVTYDHLDGVAADGGSAREPDPRFAQQSADVVLQGLQLLPPHIVGIDLQQDVGAALQIETQNDVALRPCRPALDGFFRQEVGNGEKTADPRGQQYGDRFRPGDIEHELS